MTQESADMARVVERLQGIQKLLEQIQADFRVCRTHCEATMSGVYLRMANLDTSVGVVGAIQKNDHVRADRAVQEQQNLAIRASVIAAVAALLVTAAIWLIEKAWK